MSHLFWLTMLDWCVPAATFSESIFYIREYILIDCLFISILLFCVHKEKIAYAQKFIYKMHIKACAWCLSIFLFTRSHAKLSLEKFVLLIIAMSGRRVAAAAAAQSYIFIFRHTCWKYVYFSVSTIYKWLSNWMQIFLFEYGFRFFFYCHAYGNLITL